MTMPERLNRVTILLSKGPSFDLPWDSRDELIGEMSGLESAGSVVRKFHGAGASTPIRFDDDEKQVLADVIEMWLRNDGRDALPAGIFELRNRLAADRA